MLRPYQEKALNEIRSCFKRGIKKVLYWSSTGSGKTVVFCEIIKAASAKGTKCMVSVRGRKLVQQASNRLAREGVHHGVLMSGHRLYRPHALIQICSIDTLHSRGIYPEADLIVIDECHQATSQSYVKFCLQYPNAHFVSVTATPFTNKSLRHCADEIINTITMGELTKQGFLVPARYFCPVSIDLSDVQIDSKTKDFNQKQLGFAVDKRKIVGDIVESWKKYGDNRPSICFAVSVAHSKHIVEQFNQAGIPAVHCDANSSDEYRDYCLKKLKDGEYKVLSNVGLFGVGVDLPFLSCLILARPTESLMLYLQQIGRGLRPFDNKSDCIVLDHAENVMRHGVVLDEHEASIDGKPKNNKSELKRCPECFAVFKGLFPCPECDFMPDEKEGGGERKINAVEGELQELKPKVYEIATPSEIRKEIARLTGLVEQKGYVTGWLWHVVKAKYGPEVANFYLSNRFRK